MIRGSLRAAAVIALGALEKLRENGCTETSLAKYLSHLRGLLDYASRSVRSERNVLDGTSLRPAEPRVAPRSLTLEEAEKLVLGNRRPIATLHTWGARALLRQLPCCPFR